MKTIRGKRFANQFITLDDRHFINCTFVDCRLQFAGGLCSLTDCAFVRPRLEFTGSAANTVALLQALNGLNVKSFFVAEA